jgi:hypothetical protein
LLIAAEMGERPPEKRCPPGSAPDDAPTIDRVVEPPPEAEGKLKGRLVKKEDGDKRGGGEREGEMR